MGRHGFMFISLLHSLIGLALNFTAPRTPHMVQFTSIAFSIVWSVSGSGGRTLISIYDTSRPTYGSRRFYGHLQRIIILSQSDDILGYLILAHYYPYVLVSRHLDRLQNGWDHWREWIPKFLTVHRSYQTSLSRSFHHFRPFLAWTAFHF